MRRYIPVILIVGLVLKIPGAPSAWAQTHKKEAIIGGALFGGLTGTYSSLVCHGRSNCTPNESWAVLGVYTGAGIGTAMLFEKVVRDSKPTPPNPMAGFARVQTLLKPGDRISVRDSSGHTSEGVIETVSDTTLRLRSGGSNRDFFESDVAEISQRRHVPRGSFFIPVVIGSLVAGAIAIPNTNSGKWCTGKGAGTCVLGSAALGGALYLGVSALPKSKVTVFTQSVQGPRTGINVRIAPIISKDTHGALMSINF